MITSLDGGRSVAEAGLLRRAASRSFIDWQAVERDYRGAGLSLRELSRKHGCSHSAIANRAGRDGWIRARP